MNGNYTPSPIDSSSVELPEELKSLSEELAKNTHEVWSQSRMSQGWTWGERRDDALKKHPNLIPYEELSEEEKDYDRNTSMQTLKLLKRLGYEITHNSGNDFHCPDCGRKITPDMSYCPQCGRVLQLDDFSKLK